MYFWMLQPLGLDGGSQWSGKLILCSTFLWMGVPHVPLPTPVGTRESDLSVGLAFCAGLVECNIPAHCPESLTVRDRLPLIGGFLVVSGLVNSERGATQNSQSSSLVSCRRPRLCSTVIFCDCVRTELDIPSQCCLAEGPCTRHVNCCSSIWDVGLLPLRKDMQPLFRSKCVSPLSA